MTNRYIDFKQREFNQYKVILILIDFNLILCFKNKLVSISQWKKTNVNVIVGRYLLNLVNAKIKK